MDPAKVVIVGGGHNGLVTAFYLARAGMRVEVLEARNNVGGAVATEELIPGFRFSTCAFRLWGLRKPVIEDMRLADRVTVRKPEAVLRLYPEDRSLRQWSDLSRTAAELESFSPGSSARLLDWSMFWEQAGSLYEPFVLREPPSEKELRERSVEIGEPGLYDVLRTTNMVSLVQDHFSDEAVQGAYIAAPADPRQPGSPLETAWASIPLEEDWAGLPVGGMGALSSAMAAAAVESGAVIKTESPVKRILVDDEGLAVGVELQDGSCLDSDIVVSNLSPRATYTRLVDSGALDPQFLKRVNGILSTIGYLKFHAGLREPMDLSRYLGPDYDPNAASYMRITRSISHYVSAWEDSAAGRPARDPVIQLGTHSVLDPASAPPGVHAVSALVAFAPPELEEGTWDDIRTSAAESVIDRITEYVPNFREALVDYVMFTPTDLENRLGMLQGDIHHGDHLPGQFFIGRPFPGSGGWRSPISGLYLCGAGTHPGGEVSGSPGYNCAAAILSDRCQ